MCALVPPPRRRRPRAPAILGQREHWREHKTQCVKSVQRTGRPTSGAVPPARPTAQGPSRKGNQVIAGTPLYGDHFRASSPAALQRANAAGPPPGVPRRSRAELSRPPPAGARVGLRNEGNTCYLTCVLQALTYSPLAGYLLEVEVGNAPTKRGFNMMFELARHVRKVWSRNEMLSRCEPIAPVDPASDSDDEPDDGDDGAAAPGRRRRRAPRKRSTEELVVSKQLLSCTRHAGRMEDAHECLTYVLAQLLEACGVGYDGPTDAAWERSTLVHDVFECTLGQAVVCGACGERARTLRHLELDNWTPAQYAALLLGGNGTLRAYLDRHGASGAVFAATVANGVVANDAGEALAQAEEAVDCRRRAEGRSGGHGEGS